MFHLKLDLEHFCWTFDTRRKSLDMVEQARARARAAGEDIRSILELLARAAPLP